MLINLNNYNWVNKNQIVSIDVEYTIQKPTLLQNLDKAMLIWMKEENNHYYNYNKVNYKILVCKLLNVYFSNGSKHQLVCKVTEIGYKDLNIKVNEKLEYYNLFYCTMKLNVSTFTRQVNDNKLISYVEKLLKDESKIQDKSFSDYIKEYHDKIEMDAVASEIKDEVINNIKELYGLHR